MLISKDWISKQDKEAILLSAWQRLVNLMAELCHTPAGFIVQSGAKELKIMIANDKAENPYEAGAEIDNSVNIFCRKVVKLDAPLYENAATEKQEWIDNPEVVDDGFNTYLGYPLHWPDGSVFGTICVMDFAKTDYDERYYKLLEHFRDMAERELELYGKNLQLEHIAYEDDLTKVLNRKGFFEQAKQSLDSSEVPQPLVHVCYFDIDNLKPINDRYGHQVGDEVIQRFAQHISNTFDNIGIVGRFGGDEFVVMLLDESEDGVCARLKQLTKDISQDNTEPHLCYSFGYESTVISNSDMKKLEQVIGEADKKMYQSKLNRNDDCGQ